MGNAGRQGNANSRRGASEELGNGGPNGPTIRLAVAIFKSTNPTPAPDPILILQGGPGTPLLEYDGPLLTPTSIANTRGDRDLILLDQPGTLALLWALRLYVLLMMVVVAYQIWVALHS